MSILRGALTVFRFEMSRSLTASRLLAWSTLVLFPAAILALRFNFAHPDIFGLALLTLIPLVVCMLGLLLWASPVIHSELEGKTWIYLACRPRGRAAVLVGKYLMAVTWTLLAGLCAVTLCICVAGANRMPVPLGRLWFVFAVLILLACATYGALFVLIGVLFNRRAMVVCVAYSIVTEFIIPSLPAATVLVEFTVNFRLRNLMLEWMAWRPRYELDPIARNLISEAPAWLHLVVLVFATILLLGIALGIVQKREFITADES